MSNFKNKGKSKIVDDLIVFFLFIVLLLFKSIKTFASIFSYGFLKKEILNNKSDLGFDIKIKIK